MTFPTARSLAECRILAIDPGPVKSAWVDLVAMPGGDSRVRSFGHAYNGEVESVVADVRNDVSCIAIEMIASYGMAVGATTFDTCVQIGRFVVRAELVNRVAHLIFRKDVKLHLCGSVSAKDANIRQALIDKWGGKEKAIGNKKSPGPLYGISGDVWSALAVAVTWAERGGR